MRIFAAIALPEDVRAAFGEAISNLKRQHPGAGRWSRAENLHLTLAFIGEVPPAAAQEAAAALAEADSVMLSWKMDRFGTFGRLKILWCGLEDSRPAEALAAAVRAKLSERGIAFDAKPFRAHITLARDWTGPNPEQLPEKLLPAADGQMRPARAKLFATERDESGRIRYRWVQARSERLRNIRCAPGPH